MSEDFQATALVKDLPPCIYAHSLDDVVAFAEHEQQRHLAQGGRGHAFLLHLRSERESNHTELQ